MGETMAGLKIYGMPQTRAFRVLWMAKETGVDFEHVPINHQTDAKQPDYVNKVHPMGKVPAIDDNGFVLWESMAINLYLAKKQGGDLAPKSLEEEAKALQWSFFAMTAIEPHLLQILLRHPKIAMLPPDEGAVAEAKQQLDAPLKVLDQELANKPYLLGDRFTVADLNVASVLAWAQMGGVDLSAYPNLQKWLGSCLSRPAVSQAQRAAA